MKFAPLAAALALVAAPTNAQEQTAPEGYKEVEGLVLECPNNIPFLQCLSRARDISIEANEPVLAIYPLPQGDTSYVLVSKDDVQSIDKDDVIVGPTVAPVTAPKLAPSI